MSMKWLMRDMLSMAGVFGGRGSFSGAALASAAVQNGVDYAEGGKGVEW